MRRPAAWFRTVATLLALWLPLVAGEPGVLQPCAMHGSGQLVVAHAEHMHHGASASNAADHGDHAHHAPAQQSHDHHNCSCISCCSAAPGGFVAPTSPEAIVAVVAIAAGRSVPTVESLARPAPNYDPPLTTGPPRLVRGASRA